jgi:hypothetical protein
LGKDTHTLSGPAQQTALEVLAANGVNRHWIGTPDRATLLCSRTGTCCACLPPAGSGRRPARGQHFLLDTGTLCVLGYYRDAPAVKVWNGPLPGPDRSVQLLRNK